MSEENIDLSTVKMGGMAWIPKPNLTERQANRIRKETTVRVKPGPYDDGPKEIETFVESDFHIGIPRGFYFRTSGGKLPVDYRVSSNRRDFNKGVEPWNELQENGINAVVKELRSQEVAGTIMCAATGVGKTVMALLAAAELGYATMVLVHTTSLLHQWVERIETDPGVLPGARVGIFRGEQEDFGEDYDVVIGMMQTLSNRDSEHPVFDWPGLVITDECHRSAAPTFQSVIHKFKAKKRLGLTATPRRRDNAEQVFFDALGEICWEGSTPMLKPMVRKVETSFSFRKKDYPLWVEQRIMSRDKSRNQLIAGEMALARKKDRQILVLTKRLSQLLMLKHYISRYSPESSVGMCCGSWYLDESDALDSIMNYHKYQNKFKSSKHDGIDRSKIDKSIHKVTDKGKVKAKRKRVSKEDFDVAKEQDIIMATYKAVSEGFDVKRLDTLFIAYPIWDCEQATGRILRKDKDKKDPIVVHFVDSDIPKFRKAWEKCRKKYKELGAPF